MKLQTILRNGAYFSGTDAAKDPEENIGERSRTA